MKFIVDYNSQRNNINFKGKFSAWWQCFTTSSWMLMSYFCDSINGTDDIMLATYLDDVEDSIGKPGIAEWVKKKYSWIKGRTSFWWLVQKHGVEKWMWHRGENGEAIFEDLKMSLDEVPYLLKHYGPVILGTKRIGGLKGGHIILVVGYDKGKFICHDPFGNAKHGYTIENGEYVEYDKEWLKKYTGEKIRCIYWRR